MEHRNLFISKAWIIASVTAVLAGGCAAREPEQKATGQQSASSVTQLLTQQRGAHQLSKDNRDVSAAKAVSHAQEADSATFKEPVRGIYVSGYAAGSVKAMGRLRELARKTEINAMVIDIKDDYGLLTYSSQNKLVKRLGADRRPVIQDPKKLIRQLHDDGLYVIGRQVVFKDALLAGKVPDWAIHEKSGKLWRDAKRKAWINPYRTEVWKYNVEIAREAAKMGFDEIQFDYVRFPANSARTDAKLNYGERGGSKASAIKKFLHVAAQELHREGVKVSADVFGLVTSSPDDLGIGQSWRSVASEVDAISPMVYPSHYSPGMYGIAKPDLSPYEVIQKAMTDASSRNRYLTKEGGKPAAIRPWLQSFTASWLDTHLDYTEREVKAQIRAARQAGVEEYLLWSPRCVYPLSFEKPPSTS
ncbi:putative glycoside hydrolase [Paenibacillus pasadenensis]|uniref:putative glycoside hydrolase n=1 Tax=Paenibacillus pasadenensis TaxID=217090 RepID=UPI00203ED7FD|nr:putative glycoside hydrolase [Paenibacillus pasadenensis]MCM3750339.1 putative glycoside hydrolase [Paenibacillus pasadenensis]